MRRAATGLLVALACADALRRAIADREACALLNQLGGAAESVAVPVNHGWTTVPPMCEWAMPLSVGFVAIKGGNR